MNTLPILYVEGDDDIGVINALLFRHGLDTKRGHQFLLMQALKNDDGVLSAMPEAIRASTDRAVGFVIDIDAVLSHRWDAVRERLKSIEVDAPASCPPEGFIHTYPRYRCPFGVWLMPDCATDHAKLENLIATLVPHGDPLWPHAITSVARAAEIADEHELRADNEGYDRFRDVDAIKAEVHTWLAWRSRPGAPLGAAINAKILGCDSPPALTFLRWLKLLYRFDQLSV